MSIRSCRVPVTGQHLIVCEIQWGVARGVALLADVFQPTLPLPCESLPHGYGGGECRRAHQCQQRQQRPDRVRGGAGSTQGGPLEGGSRGWLKFEAS